MIARFSRVPRGITRDLHNVQDGWDRMPDGRWHFLCGCVALCGAWVTLRGLASARYHSFPVCLLCLKRKFAF